ncbi:cutinase family protein [Streptomyces sp. SA15]|uniref:cutinase family protein n=1 Tax=Streptomyces sp. SA15 TaxID=934019 RepID=UPI00211C3CA5|nr:cutinase family protein [Streptomyces sp. SA15]
MRSEGIISPRSSVALAAVMTAAAILLPLHPAHSTTGSDLSPTDIVLDSADLKVGRKVHFDSGIKNLEDQDTPAFNIKWFVNGEEVDAYGSHAGVPARKTVLNGNSQFDWTFTQPGTYTITFEVDVDNHVAETDETNNSRSIKIKVAGATSESPPQKCRKIVFIGMRGSGEKAYEFDHKMGDLIFRGVFAQFVQHANYAGVEVEPVGFDGEDYPATAVWDFPGRPSLWDEYVWKKQFPSVRKGVDGLAEHMEEAVRDPRNCIALAGYSQGAWVITRYLWQHPEYKDRISAVVLFGDPLFKASGPVSRGEHEADGVIRAVAGSQEPSTYYNDMQDRVRSYCEKGDFVCNFTDKNLKDCGYVIPLCPHFSYIAGVLPHGYTEDGTAFLVKKLLPQ